MKAKKFDLDSIMTHLSTYQRYLVGDCRKNIHALDASVYDRKGRIKVVTVVKYLSSLITISITEEASRYAIGYKGEERYANLDLDPYIAAIFQLFNELEVTHFPFHWESDDYKMITEVGLETFIEMKRSASATNQLLERYESVFENYAQNSFDANTYHIEMYPTIEDGRRIKLNFKVGIVGKKTFVIKNLFDFIHNVYDKHFYRYGKGLGFLHDYDRFDDTSKKIIDFLSHAVYENSDDHDRQLILNPHTLDYFYEAFKDQEIEGFVFDTNDDKVVIHCSKSYRFHLFDVERRPYFTGESHIYLIEDEDGVFRISRLTHGSGINSDIIFGISRRNPFTVHESEYPKVFKYLIEPLLEDVEFIDLEVPEAYTAYPMTVIYGDLNDQDQICFDLYFQNEDGKRVDGFTDDGILKTFHQTALEHTFRQQADSIEGHTAIFNPHQEKTFDFISNTLPQMENYASIYVSDAIKRVIKPQKYTLNVGVKVLGDLLTLEFDSDIIPKKDIATILAQYQRKKKFYRLKSGEVIHLETPEFTELQTFLDHYHIQPNQIKNGQAKLNKNKMFSLNQEADQLKHIQLQRQKSFTQAIERFNQSLETPYQLAPNYEAILRDYQKEGVNWLKTLHQYGFGGILADDMGLGKTLQVIAFIDSLKIKKPSIVVCPASLIYNWQDEVAKFTSSLPCICIVGNQAKRKELIESIQGKCLVVTSYDYIRNDITLYQNLDFEYAVIDEAQYIKNQKTKSAEAVKQLKAAHKIALSGTPIENSLAELWSIFDFIMPDYLFNYHYFRNAFEKDIVKNRDSGKTTALRQLVSPFILRRNKKDVLQELPDKYETTQVIGFTPAEQELYLANLASANTKLQEIMNSSAPDKIQILALLTRLRQLCCEPRLVYENITEPSSKLKACMELVERHVSHGEQILIFSTFTSCLDFIEEALKYTNYRYCKLTGSVNKERRKEMVEQFQEGNIDVFLISLKAGGTGLNLTKATAVIHFDPWWNMAAQNQATDRAYRIGQTKNVQVTRLVMKDSIEEKIIKLQEAKKEIADLFVEGHETSIASMSKDDIMALFK